MPKSNLFMTDPIQVDCVVALYQDANRVGLFLKEISRIYHLIPTEVSLKIIFIDDGSTDFPQEIIESTAFDFEVELISLSRNFGKEAALTSGIRAVTGDVCILLDVDLQDPPELIPALVTKWMEGQSDVVLAIRDSRRGERGIRRTLSRLYLRILRKISGIEFHPGAGETRLISRKVVETLNQFEESQRFMRGLLTWVGFRTSHVLFERSPSPERSRFRYRKLIKLAIDGVVSFSLTPLRFVTLIGFITLFLSGLLASILLYFRVTNKITLPGFSSTLLIVLFMSSIQVLSLGLIGEYLGRTLLESKRRPIYIIRDTKHWPRRNAQELH